MSLVSPTYAPSMCHHSVVPASLCATLNTIPGSSVPILAGILRTLPGADGYMNSIDAPPEALPAPVYSG